MVLPHSQRQMDSSFLEIVQVEGNQKEVESRKKEARFQLDLFMDVKGSEPLNLKAKITHRFS